MILNVICLNHACLPTKAGISLIARITRTMMLTRWNPLILKIRDSECYLSESRLPANKGRDLFDFSDDTL